MFADLRKTPNKSLEKCAEANDNFHNSSESSTTGSIRRREKSEKMKNDQRFWRLFISNIHKQFIKWKIHPLVGDIYHRLVFASLGELTASSMMCRTKKISTTKKGEQTRIIINVEVFA